MNEEGKYFIERAKKEDLDRVAEIWLEGNLEAHVFIEPKYWRSNLQEVKRQMEEAELYLCVWNGKIAGFIGLVGEYVAGLFVKKDFQGKGVGTSLLQYVKERKKEIWLKVYAKNKKACRFYISQGFVVEKEQQDEKNKEREFVMGYRVENSSIRRCRWCNEKNPEYVAYHDMVWGRAEHEDKRLFAMFLPETFQAGLSWECLLNKMEAFREAFDDFDRKKIAAYDETKVEELMRNKSIVRNRRKIEAAIVNARVFLEIEQEFGSFDRYIWGYTKGKSVYETDRTNSPLSDTICKDLRSRGMRFIGSTTVYAYLQAIGVVFAHDKECFLYEKKTK